MIILTALAAMQGPRPGHLGAVSVKKYHDIVILSFCNIVKGQANGNIAKINKFTDFLCPPTF